MRRVATSASSRGRQRRGPVHADRVGPETHRLRDGGDRERDRADLRRLLAIRWSPARACQPGCGSPASCSALAGVGVLAGVQSAGRMVGGRRHARGRPRGILLRRRRSSIRSTTSDDRSGPPRRRVRRRRPRPPALRSRATPCRDSGLQADRIGPRARHRCDAIGTLSPTGWSLHGSARASLVAYPAAALRAGLRRDAARRIAHRPEADRSGPDPRRCRARIGFSSHVGPAPAAAAE